jgi:integrase
MSVRKRTWNSGSDGATKEAWIVDYADQHGKRHLKTFARKKEADAFALTAKVEVRSGTHTADADSLTVSTAGERWIEASAAERLQRSTLDEYRRHLDRHIAPYLGNVRLSRLTAPMVADFRNKLLMGVPPPGEPEGCKRTPAMTRKIVASLGSILAHAQAENLVAQNVVRTARKKRRKKADQRRKLRVGVDFPTPDEVKAMVGKLEGRWRPLLLTAIFTGLRASELRGLRWVDVDLKKAALSVSQRADRYNEIDAPKSEAGERTVPLPPTVVNVLREWRLVCPKGPKGELDLVFPNGAGRVESHANIVNRALVPVQLAAGITEPVKDAQGRPVRDENGRSVLKAKYTGLHALRHFYAAWCINRKQDGGLELPLKTVQTRLGHASITMTADAYGGLFERGDDSEELAAAERLLLG